MAATKLALEMTERSVSGATAAAAQEFVIADATTSAYTVTGPTPAAGVKRWAVKRLDTSANLTSTNVITVSYVNYAGATVTVPLTLAGETRIFRAGGSGFRTESSDTPKAELDKLYGPSRPPTFAVIGDSTSLVPGAGMTWPQLLQSQSGGKIRSTVGTQAVAGTTTAHALGTQLPAVLAMYPRPSYCVVLDGTNDIGATGPTISLATTQANLTAIYTALLNVGIVPVACTITPRNANADVPRVRDLNNWIRGNAAIRGIPCVDVNAALVDWQTGFYLSGLNADTVHPNSAGVIAMTSAFLNVINGANGGLRVPLPPSLLPIEYAKAAGEAASAQINTNPLLIDSDANNIPDSWAVSDGSTGTAVGTVVSDSRFTGKAFKIVSTAQTGFFTLKQQYAQARWAVGDRMRLIVAYAMDAPSGITAGNGLDVSAYCVGPGTAFYALQQWAYATPAGVGCVASVDFTVPAGTTNIQPQAVATLAGTSTSYIAQFGLVNLTTLSLTALP